MQLNKHIMLLLPHLQMETSTNGDRKRLFHRKFRLPKFENRGLRKPETSPNGSPTVRVALQEPKTVTQLRFFKLR